MIKGFYSAVRRVEVLHETVFSAFALKMPQELWLI